MSRESNMLECAGFEIDGVSAGSQKYFIDIINSVSGKLQEEKYLFNGVVDYGSLLEEIKTNLPDGWVLTFGTPTRSTTEKHTHIDCAMFLTTDKGVEIKYTRPQIVDTYSNNMTMSQELNASISYARKSALMDMFSVVPKKKDEDIDFEIEEIYSEFYSQAVKGVDMFNSYKEESLKGWNKLDTSRKMSLIRLSREMSKTKAMNQKFAGQK